MNRLKRWFGSQTPLSGVSNAVAPDDSVAEDVAAETVYRDAALQYLSVQVGLTSQLDTKSFQAFSIGSTALPVTLALLNLSTRPIPVAAKWALGGALVCYFVLLAFATRVSFIRGLEYRPNIATLRCYADPSSEQAREGRQVLM